MKTKNITIIASLLLFFTSNLIVEETFAKPVDKDQFTMDTLNYKVFKGELKDSKTNDPLIFASVTIEETHIGTISNSDGEFILKVPKHISSPILKVSHIGYVTKEVSALNLDNESIRIKLDMAAVALDAITIYPDDPLKLVQNMMSKVSQNYANQPNMMKAFYRETIKKNRNYVGISEAVVDIYKAGYVGFATDQVKINKGRKSEDYNKMDTLVFKLQGGPATALLFDIIKNPNTLLKEEYIPDYTYKIQTVTEIDGKPHFVVTFQQNEGTEFPLYNGRYFIDANTLALSSAEFTLNLDNEPEVVDMLIRKKPLGLKIVPKNVHYLVNYKEQDGTWYLNYARGEMTFKFNWKRKLFNTTYAAMMEIAITDRSNTNMERFKSSERFRSNQKMSEEVSQFADVDFWGPMNTIEPDQSIQSAINRLKNKGRF